jgi:hypothetical protein
MARVTDSCRFPGSTRNTTTGAKPSGYCWLYQVPSPGLPAKPLRYSS